MAIALFTQKPTGWKPWHYIRSFQDSYIVPFGPFPDSYLPAKKFWAQGVGISCELYPSWTGLDSPISAFELGGGTSGTLVGSLGGLNAVSNLFAQIPSEIWGIGENPPPTLGYCIGDLYKENVYFRINALRVTDVVAPFLLAVMKNDVLQRSVLKRIYLWQGEVTGSQTITSNGTTKNFLSIDLTGKVPTSVLNSSSFGKITIVKRIVPEGGASTFSVNIVGIKENWIFEISDPGSTKDSAGNSIVNVPEPGDYYEFSNPWCIEDPLRISGFWDGVENENQSNYPKSGKNAHITSYSCPYDEIKFVGYYVWKNSEGVVVQTSNNSTLDTTVDGEWYWIPCSGANSSIYGSGESRWKEITIPSGTSGQCEFGPVEGSAVPISCNVEFKKGSSADISAWTEIPEVTYLRVEIDKGGSAFKQNWHSPILAKCWLEQGGKYFKILSQPTGNVIDVSIKDVTGTALINTACLADASIFNQYAWMISEHMMNDSYTGIFGGKISGISKTAGKTSVSIAQDKMSIGTWESSSTVYNPSYLSLGNSNPDTNSFYNRFAKDASSSIIVSPMVNKFTKYEGWKLISNNLSFDIINLSVSKYPTTLIDEYSVTVTINGDGTGLGDTAYITFDEPYERASNTQGVLTYEITEGLSDSNQPVICLNMDYVAAPIAKVVPKGIIVGICGGRWWGSGAHGSNFVRSENGLDLFVTTPFGVTSLSSMYQKVRQEDWIIYNDVNTEKVTIRKGHLGFREYPRKIEVVVGGMTEVESASKLPIQLNASKERVKAISFMLPEDSSNSKIGSDGIPSNSLLFATKENTNYYGFAVSGRGNVDFQAWRKAGSGPGDTSQSKYMNGDLFVSPVYSYKRRSDSRLYTYDTVDIGMDVKDSPIYVLGGDVSDIKVEYIKDNQTLEGIGVYDAIPLSDGEKILVYSTGVGEFKVDGQICDSKDSRWDNSNSVFIIGTGVETINWGCPIFKELKHKSTNYPGLKEDDFRLPLMVLPGCDLIGTTFNKISQRLFIFVRAYTSPSTNYIGCLSISVLDLVYSLKKCTYESDKTKIDFLYRPLSIPSEILDNVDATYASENTRKNIPVEKIKTQKDMWVRVIGQKSTKSKIESSEVINILSPFVMPDGSLGAFYDSDAGIRMIYSRNGINWALTKIIVAQNAHSPLFINEDLMAYITPYGIEVKLNLSMDIYAAMTITDAGSKASSVEELQKRFDARPKILTSSGEVLAQRLAGHQSIEGISRIFFYTPDNVLSCVESVNLIKWNIAANF